MTGKKNKSMAIAMTACRKYSPSKPPAPLSVLELNFCCVETADANSAIEKPLALYGHNNCHPAP
jgi:hypothetical protein